jgi:hypothetical protein
VRRRQDTSLDDIDVGRFFHGGGKLWFSPLAGKPVMSGRYVGERPLPERYFWAKIKRAGYP